MPGVFERPADRLAQELVVVGEEYSHQVLPFVEWAFRSQADLRSDACWSRSVSSTATLVPVARPALDRELCTYGVGTFAHSHEAVMLTGHRGRFEARRRCRPPRGARCRRATSQRTITEVASA